MMLAFQIAKMAAFSAFVAALAAHWCSDLTSLTIGAGVLWLLHVRAS